MGKKYSSGRIGTALAEFEDKMRNVYNVQLKDGGHALMVVEELVSARLYSGPMVRSCQSRTCPCQLSLSSPHVISQLSHLLLPACDAD